MSNRNREHLCAIIGLGLIVVLFGTVFVLLLEPRP